MLLSWVLDNQQAAARHVFTDSMILCISAVSALASDIPACGHCNDYNIDSTQYIGLGWTASTNDGLDLMASLLSVAWPS